VVRIDNAEMLLFEKDSGCVMVVYTQAQSSKFVIKHTKK